ncbi:hypothetical protein ACIA8O_03050 [Kitasatospora sp. NPDC051853]|uniref:hypothetical protein n=1 Tax=Kitasatospora sp. NPDC051853 TaxID=3364058 RepID=UPI0037AEE24E
MKKFTGILAAIALLVCAFSLYLLVHHSDAVPQCGDRRMEPGEVCRRVSSGGATSSTYEEIERSIADSLPIERTAAVVGGAVFVLALTANRRLARRNTP